MTYTNLYYTILYYTILYYTILYYTILYYTTLYYAIPAGAGSRTTEASLQSAKANIEPASGEGPLLGFMFVWQSVCLPVLLDPPNVVLLRAFWSLFDGIWGLLKGSWGVLAINDFRANWGPLRSILGLDWAYWEPNVLHGLLMHGLLMRTNILVSYS